MMSKTCAIGIAVAVVALSALAYAQEKPAAQPEQKADGKLVPLEITLPKPAFKGTPTQVPPGTNLEAPRKGPRPPMMVPPGLRNVARDKPMASAVLFIVAPQTRSTPAASRFSSCTEW